MQVLYITSDLLPRGYPPLKYVFKPLFSPNLVAPAGSFRDNIELYIIGALTK